MREVVETGRQHIVVGTKGLASCRKRLLQQIRGIFTVATAVEGHAKIIVE